MEINILFIQVLECNIIHKILNVIKETEARPSLNLDFNVTTRCQ